MSQFRQRTPAEDAALLVVLHDIHRRSRHRQPLTIDALIDVWGRFVLQVENGYKLSIYDYTNDLMVRDQLDEIIAGTPPTLSSDIQAILEPWDDRYRLATVASTKPILPGPDVSTRRRWWRVPRNLSGELRDDLLSDGIIVAE